MEDMIDRVAAAIDPTAFTGRTESGVYLVDHVAKEAKERVRQQARSAIRAMREPTFEMEKALRVVIEGGPLGRRVGHPFINRDSTVHENHEVAVAGWRRMIDHALGTNPYPNAFSPSHD